jgi:integrase/recombinase XerD
MVARDTSDTDDTDAVVYGEVLQPLVPSPNAVPREYSPPQPDRTLADLLAEVILRGRSPQTQRAYRADLEDFLIWLLKQAVMLPADPDVLRRDPAVAQAVNRALTHLAQVTEGDINAYLQHLLAPRDDGSPGLKPATLNRRLTPLRLLFQRLHRYHLIAVNPMEFVKGFKVGNASATVYLSRADARALEDACAGPTLRDLRDRALVVFMLATGIRSAEALGLTVADFGTVDGHAVAWIAGKGGARERIKVAPRARRAMQAYLDAAGITEGVIFRRLRPCGVQSTTPPSPRAYAVHGPLSYAGLKFILRERFQAAHLQSALSPHSLRHSFITLALRGGASLPMVQAAARHASPQTTMRYAHDMDDLDQNAVDYVNW